MRPSLSGVALSLIFAQIAATGVRAQSAPGQIEFVSPSGNIGCTYTPAGGTGVYKPVDGGPELSCDRVKPTYMRVVMGPRAVPKVYRNVGDGSCCNAEPKLPFGQVWQQGPFRCESSTSGVSCRRSSDGFGFTISRAGIGWN